MLMALRLPLNEVDHLLCVGVAHQTLALMLCGSPKLAFEAESSAVVRFRIGVGFDLPAIFKSIAQPSADLQLV
jgi:hypothetical protein